MQYSSSVTMNPFIKQDVAQVSSEDGRADVAYQFLPKEDKSNRARQKELPGNIETVLSGSCTPRTEHAGRSLTSAANVTGNRHPQTRKLAKEQFGLESGSYSMTGDELESDRDEVREASEEGEWSRPIGRPVNRSSTRWRTVTSERSPRCVGGTDGHRLHLTDSPLDASRVRGIIDELIPPLYKLLDGELGVESDAWNRFEKIAVSQNPYWPTNLGICILLALTNRKPKTNRARQVIIGLMRMLELTLWKSKSHLAQKLKKSANQLEFSQQPAHSVLPEFSRNNSAFAVEEGLSGEDGALAEMVACCVAVSLRQDLLVPIEKQCATIVRHFPPLGKFEPSQVRRFRAMRPLTSSSSSKGKGCE